MKYFTIIFGLNLIQLLTFAQERSTPIQEFKHFDKGRNIIGIQFESGLRSNKILGIQLRYGRFLAKKFNAGFQGEIEYRSSDYRAGTFGLFGRYYILNKKLSPFIEANYAYGLATQDLGQQNSSWTINKFFAVTGLAYTGILKKIGIELYGGYGYIIVKFNNSPLAEKEKNTKIAYGFRINYHF